MAARVPFRSGDELGCMARMLMDQRSYAEAVELLSMGIVEFPDYSVPFRLDQAECHWQINDIHSSLQLLDHVTQMLPRLDDGFAESEARKWSRRGFTLYSQGGFPLAERCCNSTLRIPSTRRTRAQVLFCRTMARYEFGRTSDALRDAQEMSRLDEELGKNTAKTQKDVAIQNFQKHDYQRALNDFDLALAFHSDDASKTKFKRSIVSHKSAVYFKMQNYSKALELGNESHREDPRRSKDEAERWKERGNRLFKESKFNLASDFYSLAIKFTPSKEKDLKATLLSNRSLMYIKQGKEDQALKDAKECVQTKPGWSKAQYRLGSSLLALKKYSEAMQPFSKSLQLLLQASNSSEHDQVDTLMQIISVALEVPDGTSKIKFTIPQNVVQKVVDKVVADKDWRKLYILFLGGGGEKHFRQGGGGLANGCDASAVRLQELIQSSFSDREKFFNILRDHNAQLSEDTFLDEGLEAAREGDDDKAINLLSISLDCGEISSEKKREVLERLCGLYFRRERFQECFEAGCKLKTAFSGAKNKNTAMQWKDWGNSLHKERKYELMAEYYSLAMDFAPDSDSQLITVLLSNRSLALVNLKKYQDALADSQRCIKMRPKWFRGHFRLANCLIQMGRKEDALKAFCEAHDCAHGEKDKQATAQEVISAAMSIDGGESQISCTFSPELLKYLVRDATEKQDWRKLRFLYLGTPEKRQAGGPAKECDASEIPLELLIESEVDNLHKLITVLVERGASPSGLRGCTKPPLLTAMETRKFALAVTLLKKGADPGCVVGEDTFISKEGQPRQWLQLGRRALESKDNEKALMLLNMSFHLIDGSTSLAIVHQILRAISEAHFRMREHEKCIEAGNECFRIKSEKSEEEARMWQDRANIASESEMYRYCIEYVNMALKYLPTDKERTFARLLCKRSEAHARINDPSAGLEDAISASRMDPQLLEGYLSQLKCYRVLGRQREAMQVTYECLRRANDNNMIYDLLSDALEIAAHLEEETSPLTCAAPVELVTKLVNNVIRTKAWNKLRTLYLGGGGPNSFPKGDGGLATGTDASTVPLGEILRSTVPEKLLFVSALLKQGASPNAITGSDIIPLEEALLQENLAMVEKLIKNGADPCVTITEGETIIHKALRFALKKGDLRFLEAMLRSKHPETENVQDSKGNSLYHVVCTGKKSKIKCDAIRSLRKGNINPTLPNNEGKCALDMLSKSDNRWKMIATATEGYKPNTFRGMPSIPKPESEDLDWKEQGSSAATEDDPPASQETKIPEPTDDIASSTPTTMVKAKKIDSKQQREVMLHSLSLLIENFSVDRQDRDESQMFSESQDSEQIAETFDERPAQQVVEELAEVTEKIDSSDSDSDARGKGEDEIDSDSPFENLAWEVDCTDRAWKIMRSKRVGNAMRKRIVDKIRMLANGRWSRNLCKRLEGVAKKEDIELYESKLTKSHRIIWEKTIAFSGRCSDDPEACLNTPNPEGQIYTDIIRVWDIVLKHDTLPHAIDRIVKSHDRGMECIIKKRLKGIRNECKSEKRSSVECLPNKYAKLADFPQTKNETCRREVPKGTVSDKASKLFFPPASANEQEYHILKFYSFSTALVNTVLEGDVSSKIDFPFKITELEHAIVNLRPETPSPIILLGRSGTGKTTCCLYRLWDGFQRYWKKAIKAGPHIPKYIPPTQPANEDEHQPGESPVAQNASEETIKGVTTAKRRASERQEGASCWKLTGESSSQCSYEAIKLNAQAPQMSELDMKQNEDCQNGGEMSCEQRYEHWHQVFITKNTVLCSEVEKNFKELCRACPETRNRVQLENTPIPPRIQDVEEYAWPLFVSSRDWLLMLDASLPGKPFFQRAADGRLLRKIVGWGEDNDHLQFIPVTELDEEGSDEEDEEKEDEITNDRRNQGNTQNQEPKDPRTEITYQVFKTTIWPKMRKSLKEKVDYHPTLVWTEIRSFIKGSSEALLNEDGVLTREEYKSLGKKKAPSFTADREIIYDLFQVYQRIRSSNRMFDEADLVFKLHQRLQNVFEWSIHEFYVDETQDFTQAELSLLIRCCRFPNRLFFTGDTAQSIMRGIAFRFDDLKSLFHHARLATGQTKGDQAIITVPKKLYQLTHNYRSHAGILRLASSIVDLLVRFFPESFDRLEKDQGLFEGPKPVILEACSVTDLAMILRGNRRQSSRIEFGAHQVVLVASNEARESMPDELKHGLVMTIYESKGLEFDDVLIYNFFKDSQALKEWRVVTSFTKQLQRDNESISSGLVELSEESVKSKPSRPLEFDHEKHKVLNSEFKNLYTAITRARVNVWFFDEQEEARSPIFEYFQEMGLVRLVALETDANDSNLLASMFAAQSTPDEWRKGGHQFYKKKLWSAAIQCFTFAGDELMLQRSRAQQQAAEANKLRATNRQQMSFEFLKAAESFLKCGMHYEAEICLHNAREWILLAKLYKKTGKFKNAARLFKREGMIMEASQCYESYNNYAEAIEVLCQVRNFEGALSILERFNSLARSGPLEERHGVVPPKVTRTIERLCFQLADQYFQNKQFSKMEDVLQRLPSPLDRITFLKKRECISEAARAMENLGRRGEAAQLLRETGRFKEAISYSSDPQFVADCMLFIARADVGETNTSEMLEQALEKYQQCSNLNGQAEVLLLLGKRLRDAQKVQDAGRLFEKSKNCCGEVESVTTLLDLTDFAPPKNYKQWVIVRSLERALRLVVSLFKPADKCTMAEQIDIAKCEAHFGLSKTDNSEKLMYWTRCGGRFAAVDPQHLQGTTVETKIMIDTTEAHHKIGWFVSECAGNLIQKILKMLNGTFTRNSICSEVKQSKLCDNKDCPHHHEDTEQLFSVRFEAGLNEVHLESVVEWFGNEMLMSKHVNEVPRQLIFEEFRNFLFSQRFYEFLCPSCGFRDNQLPEGGKPLVTATRKSNSVRNRLFRFAQASWSNLTKEKRRTNTDNFLKVSFCLQLIGMGNKMVAWICEEEREFTATRSQKTVSKLHLSKNGMVSGQTRDKEICYESYLQWWEKGKRRLFVYGDVESAAHSIIRRFLTLAAKRAETTTYPSIANTVMILEHQLTSCLALYARLCKSHQHPICLPSSYLSMVQFWDNLMLADKPVFTLYRAVENSASQAHNREVLLTQVQSILSHMVRLTCGDLAQHFDVLADALGSKDSPRYCSTGEAERSLILVLVMLCNCGKGIPSQSEKILLRNIWRIQPYSCLPDRISNVLEDVKGANGYQDVVETLKRLLQSRREEMYDLRWHNCKLWQDGPSNPGSYPDRFTTDVCHLREDLKGDQSQSTASTKTGGRSPEGNQESIESLDENIDVSTDLKNRDYRKEEEKALEQAREHVNANVIQKWFRRIKAARKFCLPADVLKERQLKRAESREDETKFSKFNEGAHLALIRLDSSACGICGASFEQIAESIPFGHVGDILNGSSVNEEHSQSKAGLGRSVSLEEEQNSFEAHATSSSHAQKEEEFNQYKNLRLETIHQLVSREKQLPIDLKEFSVTESMAETRSVGVELDLERLEGLRNVVTSEMQAIESSRRWSDTDRLIHAVKEYEGELQNFQRIVENAQKAGGENNEDEEADMDEQDDDDDSPLGIPHKEEKRGKHKRQRRRGRKR